METLQDFLRGQLNEQMRLAVLSGQRRNSAPSRIKIRPVEIGGRILYQASVMEGTQVFHKNYSREEMIGYVERALGEGFSQLQIQGEYADGSVVVSRKGKAAFKTRAHAASEPVRIEAHNRVKNYILKEGTAVPFLVDLGVMTKEGKVVASRYDKFRQINRFLEFIADILPRLSGEREITVLDFGCGKSYLTFAMYYYLHQLKGYDVRIIGLDLKEDVIRRCSRLAENYGYEKLQFCQGDIAHYEGVHAVDMVVTLHACDTATDYALAKAVEWGGLL